MRLTTSRHDLVRGVCEGLAYAARQEDGYARYLDHLSAARGLWRDEHETRRSTPRMSTAPGQLSPASRESALSAADGGTFDVVVVGGGITGAGCALDAATRGLSVLLVEAGDLAAGTSSRSGKTAHGGLRYLEQLNFSLVAEALRERDRMIGVTAPHLVGAEPFLLPTTRWWERPYFGAGVLAYDTMARSRGRLGVPRHRHLGRASTHRRAPGLAPSVTGAIRFYDGRMDDARHTLAVARTAAREDAAVLTHTRVTGALLEGERVCGLRLADELSGREVEVRAGSVINAAGVWAADVQRLAGPASFSVRPAKGVHLLVDGDAFDSDSGLIARAEDSVIVLRRWYGNWLLGTTDTAYDGDRATPSVEASDVGYLLRNVNRYLSRPLTRADVLGAYAGLRPLLSAAGGPGATSALSRDHTVITGPAGMVTVVGGKYTTYRVMAREAVDAAARSMGRDPGPSRTADLPLVGADGRAEAASGLDRLAAEAGTSRAAAERMLHRYGGELPELLRGGEREMAGHLDSELRRAVTHEGAMTLSDVLVRRTRVSLTAESGGTEAAPEIAGMLAPLLGWSADRADREVERFRAEIGHDRAALSSDWGDPKH
ncbi:glycerol-3-phosphate dehydrogenase/oxidase [Nocardiopsis xinjiangensis]|uniref:glycerol-3-phosphate dehydrogenase/oxidase n=1 Tax=Nocardiopsis xinjiangensis TaxID=124285 RepID=UPI00034DB08B|nr:glycerol-3-phosphate dehydrogenase/oxidase [Nocardiopsis xinjiangensis]